MTASMPRRPRPTGLTVERLEDRTTPDATFHKLFVTEHIDLAFDHTPTGWELSSQFGVVDYDPATTLHYVPPAARLNRPAGSQWDFIGTGAGQPLYLLPQGQNASLLFLGASSEETPNGTFAEYTETDPRVPTFGPFPWLTVQLAAVRGPGHFSAWQSDQFGATTVWMSSFSNGIDPSDKLLLLEGAHAHFNWAFSAPGVYEIDFRASAVLVSSGQVSQSPVVTYHFTVDDALKVTSVTPTESGFLARFNRPIDTSRLNLYDAAGGTLGAADAALVGSAVGAVRGSFVVPTSSVPNQTTGNLERAPALNAVEFVRTGGPLAADAYTVTLRSENTAYATNTAFRTTSTPSATSVLDGNGDGTTGDSHVTTFTVGGSAARLVSLPDVVRGFGQSVTLPITIDNASGVTRMAFDLRYDPALLTIAAVTRGGSVPATFTVALDTTVAGRARVTLDGPTGLPAGMMALVQLTGSVPSAAPYADKHVLRLTNVSLNSGAVAGRADHAIHVAALPGDTTGNRGYSGLDAANILRVASGLDGGFPAFQNADPTLIADVSGDGAVSSLDATLLAQKTVGLTVPELPDPPGTGNPPAGGPDPRLFIPTNLTGVAGGSLVVPVRIEVTEAGGVTFRSADVAIGFDPAKFAVANARVTGTLLAGFAVVANVDNVNGTVRAVVYSSTGVTHANGTVGDITLLDFGVKAGAAPGPTQVNLLADNSLTRTSLNEGQLTLAPAPTNGSSDANVDGTITLGAPAVIDVRVNGSAAQRSRLTVIEVTFNTTVTLAANAFNLSGTDVSGNPINGNPTIAVTTTIVNGRTVATLTFSGTNTESGSLSDGVWVLRVDRTRVTAGSIAMAADYTTPNSGTGRLYRLFGDTDGNGVVNSDDLDQFFNSFGLSSTDPGFSLAFDFDGNGVINSDDLDQFFNRFGLTL